MLLVQFKDDKDSRRVGSLEANGSVRPLRDVASTYALAQEAIASKRKLLEMAIERMEKPQFDCDRLAAEQRLLPPLDHPDPAHCFVTGTGLTHLGSADARDSMHKKLSGAVETLTDSMKMFRMGLEGGKPEGDRPGVQPEWFYKGDGSILRGCGEPLAMPDFSGQ